MERAKARHSAVMPAGGSSKGTRVHSLPRPMATIPVARAAEADAAVGADDLGLVVGAAVPVADGDGDAGDAVLVVDEGDAVVVAGLVVALGSDAGLDASGLGTDEPGKAIDDVDAVGHPVAAAVEAAAVLGPAVGIAPVLDRVANGSDERAKLAGVEDFLGFHIGAEEVLGEADHELDVVAAGGLNHVVALLKGEGHGLLDEDVLAGVEGIDGEAVVELVAEGDGDGVDFVVLEQFGVAGVGAGDLVALAEGAAGGFEEVGGGDDFDVGQGLDGVAV